jgi:hypothetical protein
LLSFFPLFCVVKRVCAEKTLVVLPKIRGGVHEAPHEAVFLNQHKLKKFAVEE